MTMDDLPLEILLIIVESVASDRESGLKNELKRIVIFHLKFLHLAVL